jgi:hypothetical protein
MALALHVSVPLHALPSPHDVPGATGVCTTPIAGSQVSAVQGLPSSTPGGGVMTHTPTGSHVSVPLHALLSPHDVPGVTGVCVTPPAGVHPSVVHGLPSSTGTTPVPLHVPPWHLSIGVHALPSLHVVPSGFAGFEQTPVVVLQVPAV